MLVHVRVHSGAHDDRVDGPNAHKTSLKAIPQHNALSREHLKLHTTRLSQIPPAFLASRPAEQDAITTKSAHRRNCHVIRDIKLGFWHEMKTHFSVQYRSPTCFQSYNDTVITVRLLPSVFEVGLTHRPFIFICPNSHTEVLSSLSVT